MSTHCRVEVAEQAQVAILRACQSTHNALRRSKYSDFEIRKIITLDCLDAIERTMNPISKAGIKYHMKNKEEL